MTVDKIYELVVENMYESIPVQDWEIAFLNVEGDDTSIGLNGCYIVDGEEHSMDVGTFDPNVEFALMELHEIMSENDSNNWSKAIVTLLPNGLFNIEFEYDLENDENI